MSEVGPHVAATAVCAIVVTYNPEPETLRALLQGCRRQVSELVVVDNGSEPGALAALRDLQDGGFTLIELGNNRGVAAAQNIGIDWARRQGCPLVLILDQDSLPADDMVATLHTALHGLMRAGLPVAAVGPRLVDRRTGRSSPGVRISWFGVTRIWCRDGEPSVYQTDFLISSGMLAPVTSFDRVGLLEEGLFVDNVDLEWCFRARSKELALYGVCDAVLLHSVGDQVFNVGGAVLHRHAPLRQYYIMRNRLLLYRRGYTPFGWIVQDSLRALLKVFLFAVVFSPRRENIRMICRGIRDALLGKQGPYRG